MGILHCGRCNCKIVKDEDIFRITHYESLILCGTCRDKKEETFDFIDFMFQQKFIKSIMEQKYSEFLEQLKTKKNGNNSNH